MKEDDERGLLAYEMRCYRNMLRARWRDKVSNDNIRQKVDRKETIMDIIRRRKLLLFGHICRMPDDRLVKTVLLGSVDGIRWRGRPPKKWTDNITDWTELSVCEAVWLSQDRASWNKTVFGINGF